MTVQNIAGGQLAETPDLVESVHVTDIGGGEETSPIWTSEVGSAEFREALIQSLQANGLLSPDETSARYDLAAQIVEVDQPLGGFNMTVVSKVRYRATDRTTGAEFFNELIQATYTATFDDAFIGAERLQLANEGSAQTNIRYFINQFVPVLKAHGAEAPSAPDGTPSAIELQISELRVR